MIESSEQPVRSFVCTCLQLVDDNRHATACWWATKQSSNAQRCQVYGRRRWRHVQGFKNAILLFN